MSLQGINRTMRFRCCSASINKIKSHQKFTTISKRFYQKTVRSNNDVLNAMAMANEFRLKYKWKNHAKKTKQQENMGKTVMLSLQHNKRLIKKLHVFIFTSLHCLCTQILQK